MKWLNLLILLTSIGFLNGQSLLIEPDQLDQFMKDSTIQKLDVRSSTEFDIIGHIPGFVQINVYDKEFENKMLSSFDKEKPILVTCFSGHRSSDAVTKLTQLGFVRIYELRGGLINWMGKGYKLE